MAPSIAHDDFHNVQPLLYETTEARRHRLVWKGRNFSYRIVVHQPRVIAYRLVRVVNSRGIFIIAHGYGESSARYEALAAELNRLAFGVLLIDFSGYGHSRRPPKPARIRDSRIRKFSSQSGISVEQLEETLDQFLNTLPKNHESHYYGRYRDGVILRFQEYVDDLVTAIHKAKRECPTDNLYLLGHSQGSLITHLALRQLGNKTRELGIKGVVLSSPAFQLQLKGWQLLKARIGRLVSWIPWLGPVFGLPSGISVADLMSKAPPKPAKHENEQEKLNFFLQLAQGQIVEIARARWITELLLAQAEYWTWLQQAETQSPCFGIRTLFLYGTKDPVVSIQKITEVYECCRAKNPHFFQIADFEGRHEIIQDTCRPKVFGLIERWCNEVAPLSSH